MVHLVPDEGVDSGPVLAEEIVMIDPQDSLETLEARMHAVEHRLLVEAIQKVIISPPQVYSVHSNLPPQVLPCNP